MKNTADTEDAVQATFIKLMEYKGTLRDTEHEKAWLIVTASNLCRDILRKWWRKNINIDTVSDSKKTMAVFERDEILELVLALPVKYKIPVYLYYYEGYKAVEIAKILGKNESTIRSYLHSGRNFLKIDLEVSE